MLALVTLGIPVEASTAATDRQIRVFALPAGHSIAIEVTVGDVRIEAADRHDALVEIVRRAPADADLARIPIEIDETTPAIRVRAVQTDGTTDAALRTDVIITVPRDARVDGVRGMEGKITIAGMAGTIGAADARRAARERAGARAGAQRHDQLRDSLDDEGYVAAALGRGDTGRRSARHLHRHHHRAHRDQMN